MEIRNTRFLGKAGVFSALCLVGLAIDQLAFELTPGSYFSFGMFVVLTLAARFGPLAGLAAAIIVKFPDLALRIGNPSGLVIFGLEALAVGLVRRRRPATSVLSIDGLYWPLLGLPILGLTYVYLLGISFETVQVILLKSWLVGLLNAYVANAIADSALADRLFGGSLARNRGIGRFIKNRISFLLLPFALVSLVASVEAFRSQAENHLVSGIEAGLRIGQARFSAPTRGAKAAAEILAELNSSSEGTYELHEAGWSPSSSRPLGRSGILIIRPSSSPHPMEAWRDSDYLGLALFEGESLSYSIPFRSTYSLVVRLYAAALAIGLALLYASFGIIALISRSLVRVTALIIENTLRIPDGIDSNETPSWPASTIYGINALSESIATTYTRLKSRFAAINSLKGDLESAVKARTAELELRTEEVRLLLARVEREREDERIRVARELHDELGQGLAGLGMSLYILEKRIGTADGPVTAKLEDMKAILEELTEAMRALVAGLRPPVLDRLGLPLALAHLAEDSGGRSGTIVSFSSSVPEDLRIDDDRKFALFGIAKEALANSLQHSGSPVVHISLDRAADSLVLAVEDEGRGGAEAEGSAGPRRTFGLIGMRERCRAIGGELEIRSIPGRGTVVRARVPLGGGGA